MMRRLAKAIKTKCPVLYILLRRWSGVGKIIAAVVKRPKGAFNYVKCCISALVKSPSSLGRPVLLTIEPTNICDHRCAICETGQGVLGRESCMMTFERYRRILDQFDSHLRTIYFYFMGESFLNRDAYRMIRYAADRDIYVSACTNGVRIDPEALVRSGIADIQYQIAGATAEIHAAYRVGGDYERVIENVRQTISMRKIIGDSVKHPYPMKIGLGLIMLKTNEHQVEAFKCLAIELGVDEWSIVDPCVRTMDQAHALLPTDRKHWIYDPLAFENGELKLRSASGGYCEWIYGTMTIQANGDIVPCCRDATGRVIMGNALNENIYDVWNGEKYRLLRRTVSSGRCGETLCRLCEGYGMPTL